MKKIILFLMVACTTFSCCNNDDNKTIGEIDKLPPLTTTGTNKAGCLVNGVAFLPKGYSPNGSNTQVYYDGENFTLSITENLNGELRNFLLAYKNELLQEGINYQLTENFNTNLQTPFGYVFFTDSNSEFNTNETNYGELKIVNHNYEEAIISGIFWADAINNDGEKVEIREGRFDMKY